MESQIPSKYNSYSHENIHNVQEYSGASINDTNFSEPVDFSMWIKKVTKDIGILKQIRIKFESEDLSKIRQDIIDLQIKPKEHICSRCYKLEKLKE